MRTRAVTIGLSILVGLLAAGPVLAGSFGPPVVQPPDPPPGGGGGPCIAAVCYRCEQFIGPYAIYELCKAVEETNWACTCSLENGVCQPYGTCEYNP